MACKVAVLGTRHSGKSTLISNLNILSKTEKWVELPQYSPAIEQSFAMVLVLYDVTQPETFYQALDTVMKVKHLPRLLIGNKADLATYKLQIAEDPATICMHFDVLYREISADNLGDLNELLLNVVEITSPHKLALRVSNKCYTRLKFLCHWLAASTVLQGLTVVCFSALMSLEIKETWFTDLMLAAGLVTFFMSFLGYYGTHYMRCKEYVTAVSGTQYIIIIVLNFILKAVVLGLILTNSLDVTASDQTIYIEDLFVVCIYCLVNDVSCRQFLVIVIYLMERFADKARAHTASFN
jgi:hypothetical protein